MNRSEAGKLGAIKTAEIAKQKLLERIEEYNKNPRLCEECSTPISYEKKRDNKFCSQSCSAKKSNRDRILSQKTRTPEKNKEYFCAGCSKEMLISKHIKKFCSLSCQQDYKRNKKLENNVISSKSIRTLLIKKYGPVCMECGWSKENPFTKLIPIELEHIDGNSENNTLDNVKLLCPSCHSLTATYKGANKGKGRHKRRERYRQGKSY